MQTQLEDIIRNILSYELGVNCPLGDLPIIITQAADAHYTPQSVPPEELGDKFMEIVYGTGYLSLNIAKEAATACAKVAHTYASGLVGCRFVSVEERLPEKDGAYHVIKQFPGDDIEKDTVEFSNKIRGKWGTNATVISWLEEGKGEQGNDEFKAIVQALADWSRKYPRDRIYGMSQQPNMDGELIELEKRAKAVLPLAAKQ